ncbi:hypothetical protein [Embleya sp. NPDC059237]|uniref:hypothetical protein n=1 Tax=Embleya sp. NPDC059237 TaxID=3346784 RepID=UPI0036BA3A7D
MTDNNTRIVAVDGTDALGFVIIRPGSSGPGSISLEAGATGLDKGEGAYILRHAADLWDAEETSAGRATGRDVDPDARFDAIARLADALKDCLVGDSWHLADAIKRVADGTTTPTEINAEFKD